MRGVATSAIFTSLGGPQAHAHPAVSDDELQGCFVRPRAASSECVPFFNLAEKWH
jgi:hypothetical protein